jgi:hydrogenase/urease accessory protein HupE
MLVLGLLVAARLRLPPVVALALGLGVGLAHGYVATFSERETIARPILYMLGMCSGVGLLCFHLESLVLRFSAFWMQIAVRVLGSWIAAIGLLVAVLGAVGGGRGTG